MLEDHPVRTTPNWRIHQQFDSSMIDLLVHDSLDGNIRRILDHTGP